MSKLPLALGAAALLLATGLAGSAPRGSLAAPPAQTLPAGLSPEEATIPILPFLLTPKDLGAGATLQGFSAYGPSTFGADLDGAPSPAIYAQATNAGLVVDTEQTFARGASTSTLSFGVRLFTDAGKSRDYATARTEIYPYAPTETAQSVSGAPTIGDASVVLKYHLLNPDGTYFDGYGVRWQRGMLAFSLIEDTDAATLTKLAQNIDAREAKLPPPVFGAPTVAAPVTEDQRFAAMSQLYPHALTADDAPDGYQIRAGGPQWVHPAAVVSWADDPAMWLTIEDSSWHVVMEMDNAFDSTESGGVLGAQAILHTDATSAAADLANFVPAPGDMATEVDPGIALGDTTIARDQRSADGLTEDYFLEWTRGPLLLDVSWTGTPGSVPLATLAQLASTLDAKYQSAPAQ